MAGVESIDMVIEVIAQPVRVGSRLACIGLGCIGERACWPSPAPSGRAAAGRQSPRATVRRRS